MRDKPSTLVPTVSEAVQHLLEYTQGRRSPRTVGFYAERLRAFESQFGARPITSITPEDIDQFIGSLLKRNTRYASHPFRRPLNGPPSRNYVRGFERALRRLFHFAQRRRWISPSENPWADYEPIGKDRCCRPKSCHPDDVARLLAATTGDSPAAVRDNAIVHLLLDTGCRLGGLSKLLISNLNLSHREFITIEKGRLSTYFISIRTAELLERWIGVRATLPGSDGHDSLFISLRDGAPLTGTGVVSVLRRLKKRAGVSGRVNAHAFRHLFVRTALRRGVDVKATSQMVNHGTAGVTTDIYGGCDADELRDLHDVATPLSDFE